MNEPKRQTKQKTIDVQSRNIKCPRWIRLSGDLSLGTDVGVKHRKRPRGEGGSFSVPGVPLPPTWCWCCGSARTERCCCWCWGCGDSCWAWPRTSGSPHRWDSRAEVRCPRTPGCLPAGRRTASSDREHPGSSRLRRTVGGNTARCEGSTWTCKADFQETKHHLFAIRQMFSLFFFFLPHQQNETTSFGWQCSNLKKLPEIK